MNAQEIFACPQCLTQLSAVAESLTCDSCRRRFSYTAGVYDFNDAFSDPASQQAEIYDSKAENGDLIRPTSAPKLGRFPDILLTYREHARRSVG